MNNLRIRECTVTVKSPCRALMVLMVRQFTSSYIDSVAAGCKSRPSTVDQTYYQEQCWCHLRLELIALSVVS